MTDLPDWLVERAALGEVPPASKSRIDRADPQALADRIAALREASAAELAHHPARPAVAQIQERIALDRRRKSERKRRWIGWLALASSAALVAVVLLAKPSVAPDPLEDTRVKGAARLLVYRQLADGVEKLEEDTLVRGGDVIQLRYNAGGHGYGVIASVDGAGVVTLHYPLREDAPPQATAVAHDTTSLPHAYALDDAPRFERFIFITANDPIDLPEVLGAVRALAQRADSATAAVDLPAGLQQWSLRLRKPERQP